MLISYYTKLLDFLTMLLDLQEKPKIVIAKNKKNLF